jgi:hypothetical protein
LLFNLVNETEFEIDLHRQCNFLIEVEEKRYETGALLAITVWVDVDEPTVALLKSVSYLPLYRITSYLLYLFSVVD